MHFRRWSHGSLGLVIYLFATTAWGQSPSPPAVSPSEQASTLGKRWRDRPVAMPPGARLDVNSIRPEFRERVVGVLDKPSLSARGPVETFHCQPGVYRWLLDHPDRAVRMWRKLGAECADITDRGAGRFGWKDTHGGDVGWETVSDGPRQRVWFAEGMVRPGALMPLVKVRAVVILYLTEGKDSSGRAALRHQGELLLQADGRAMSLATRIVGASAPRMAEQYVGQIQTFFAALAWQLDEHPEKTRELMDMD